MNKTLKWYLKLHDYQILEEKQNYILVFDNQENLMKTFTIEEVVKRAENYLDFMINENPVVASKKPYQKLLEDLKNDDYKMKNLCVDWKLELSDDFESLGKGDKEIILSKIANDILMGFNIGSIGIDVEE